jgi:hypothetical protein
MKAVVEDLGAVVVSTALAFISLPLLLLAVL